MQAYIRRAAEDDMDLLYQWANDLTVRTHYFTVSKINFKVYRFMK